MQLLKLVSTIGHKPTLPVDPLITALRHPQTSSSLTTIKVALYDLSNLVHLLLSLEKEESNYDEYNENFRLFMPLYNQFNTSIYEGVDQLKPNKT
ncbi:MAG: hypothetical protein HEQ32_09210 [Vampirovibrio sp.]